MRRQAMSEQQKGPIPAQMTIDLEKEVKIS
jgi:hypothetical protein